MDLLKVITMYNMSVDQWFPVLTGAGAEFTILKDLYATRLVHNSVMHSLAFGTEIVSGGVYNWRIRVNKLKYPSTESVHIYVGVMNVNIAKMSYMQTVGVPVQTGCYSFEVTMGKVVHEINWAIASFDHKETKPGDIVDLTLDVEKKKVCCAINDQDIGECISEISEGEYRLVVSMYFDETELELL